MIRSELKSIQAGSGMKAAHDAYSIWAAADEHGDTHPDDVKLPLLLLHGASQLPQLRGPLPLRHAG